MKLLTWRKFIEGMAGNMGLAAFIAGVIHWRRLGTLKAATAPSAERIAPSGMIKWRKYGMLPPMTALPSTEDEILAVPSVPYVDVEITLEEWKRLTGEECYHETTDEA